jgi:hypothetical protein
VGGVRRVAHARLEQVEEVLRARSEGHPVGLELDALGADGEVGEPLVSLEAGERGVVRHAAVQRELGRGGVGGRRGGRGAGGGGAGARRRHRERGDQPGVISTDSWGKYENTTRLATSKTSQTPGTSIHTRGFSNTSVCSRCQLAVAVRSHPLATCPSRLYRPSLCCASPVASASRSR